MAQPSPNVTPKPPAIPPRVMAEINTNSPSQLMNPVIKKPHCIVQTEKAIGQGQSKRNNTERVTSRQNRAGLLLCFVPIGHNRIKGEALATLANEAYATLNHQGINPSLH